MRAWYPLVLVALALVSASSFAAPARAEREPLPAPPEPESSEPPAAPKSKAPPAPAPDLDSASADAAEPAPESDTAAPEPAADAAPSEAPIDAPNDASIEAVEQAMERASTDGEQPALEPGALSPAIAVESVPAALSSEAEPAPEASARKAVLGPELDWLAGASLPDFPVRWDDRLVEQLLYYRDNAQGRAHVRSLIARSGRYADMIRGKLDAQALPSDLLYVAMAESGYDPLAKSGAGAVGMWQFVETTGREYGLSIDRWVDERMSPERATEAASKFLLDLHAKLGSWPLALAGFNMGYGALLRSIRKYNTNDIAVLTRLEAGLPYETVVYVSKITAFAIVARNPERFGLSDVTLEPARELATVDVPGGLGLGRLARAASMTVEELAACNPELLRSRVPPDLKRWALRLPKDRAARFAERIATLPSEAPTHAMHVMRFGERIRDVASMYGTTDAKLRALNDLEDGAEALPGSKLLVPDVEPEIAPAATGEVVVGVPAQSFDMPDRKRVFYAVQSGDSPEAIAAFFAVTMDELRRWNDIATDAALQSGMVLQLFVPPETDLAQAITIAPERVRPVVVGSEEFFAHHESQRDRVRVRYRVRSGDTLDSLGERYDLSAGSIARINSFSRYSKLDAGAEIILYVPAKDAEQLVSQAAR